MADGETAVLRIGELARRTGVEPGTLRAWQRRYGLLEPERSEAGYRLYSERDVETVQRVVRLVREGVAIAQAAQLVRSARPAAGEIPRQPDAARPLDVDPLLQAVLRFDGAEAHRICDDLLARFSTSTVITNALAPLLRVVGERQAAGEVTIATEHFTSNLVRGRLWGLTRAWDEGGGDRAVLACAPGDHHDLGLLMFGIALRERGWRITFLGGATPALELADTVRLLRARAAVVSFTRAATLAIADVPVYRELARSVRLAVGGAAASADIAAATGAVLLTTDPVTASRDVAFADP